MLAVGDVRRVDRVGGLVDRDPEGVGPDRGVGGKLDGGRACPQPALFAASQVAPLTTYTLLPR